LIELKKQKEGIYLIQLSLKERNQKASFLRNSVRERV